jgi:hypothetical protein
MNPRERGSNVMPEQSCSEPIERDEPALNNAPEIGNLSDGIQVGGATERSASTLKKVLKKLCVNVPRLCLECHGEGVVVEQYFGAIMACPECKGDGIARP